MGIIEKFFGGKTAITSDAIRAEIARTEAEIATHRGNLTNAMADVATMTDAEHLKAEANIAVINRAITRLEARANALAAELPQVIAAETAAAKAAADQALRQRAESARKANDKEAAKLLGEYAKHAAQIGDILTRLNEIGRESEAVNQALRENLVAEPVHHYNTIHRKNPDREASEQRAVREVWVHPADGEVVEATRRENGDLLPPTRWRSFSHRHDPQPVLEKREIVVARTNFRRGEYLEGLSAVRLPGAFAGDAYYYPRS